jgi:diguanylate cyclase
MPEGFLIGGLFALVLVGIGMAVGFRLGRQGATASKPDDAQLQPVLSSLMQFTSSFSRDVSEYRSVIEAAAAQARHLKPTEPGDASNASALLAQIMQANELLQRRLDDAESSLQEKSHELQSYRTEARTDALTGLSNRRAFDDELSRRMATHRRQGAPVAVLLVDVDRFKSVNDRYGHPVGDMVLKAVAEALRQAVRDTDLLARYGGEEFAVLVTGNSAEEFMQAAERVRRQVELQPARCEEHTLAVTASCGIAQLREGEDTASLLRRADEALYASKTGGRNAAHWHDGRRTVRITALAANANPAATSDDAAESFRDVCAELRRKLLEIAN